MKQMRSYFPALAILIAAGVWYLRDAQQEEDLRREWSAERTEESATKPGGKVADIHEPAAPAKLQTPEQTEKLMAHWTAEILAEEQRLVDTGEMDGRFPRTEGKFAPWRAYLPGVAAADLLTICLTARDEVSLSAWQVNVRSSRQEVRTLLAHAAYTELLKRDPFLALTLPQNDPATKQDQHYAEVLMRCAKIDPDKAWKAMQEKYGGTGASLKVLNGVLVGATGPDIAKRIELARKWGVLDRIAGQWPATASQSSAGQEAWLGALREAPPPDAESRMLKFAGEVEASGGFAGVQRIVEKIAPPGTPLYDRVLQEAATHDLEEGAAQKADWILARVSTAASSATAESLMKHWTETDPLAASEWLNQVPKSTLWRSAAVLAFAKAIEFHDPAAAAEWRKAGGGR